MNKVLYYLKKNLLPITLIVLGSLIFYWVKDYREVPSGIGPAFFPKIVGTFLIGLSILFMILSRKKEKKGEFVSLPGAWIKIVSAAALFVTSTLLMEHVNLIVSIVVFLVVYLKWIAGLSWIKTAIVSVIGTGILYVAVILLKIPL